MEDAIDSLVELFEFSLKELNQCPWMETKNTEDFLTELESEIREVRQTSTSETLADELGDMFRDALFALLTAVRDKRVAKLPTLFQHTLSKIRRRKPWVEEGRQVTIDEAVEIWERTKAKERSESKGTT